MNKRGDRTAGGGKVVPFSGAAPAEELAYSVELWTLARDRPERVLGRASGAALAHAIFTAARSEHLGRRIVLRRGDRVLAEAG